MAETIRPQNYYNAAQAVLDVAAALSTLHSDTMTALADTGSMAGEVPPEKWTVVTRP
ncbi:hypothetical protein [Rhodococcus sp. 1168]|uniref:hypothetical protein n=1 Tax=Rhodococcus sp. 1168 TaxID=2018041 RepID=UPI001593FB4B|nr:hypothetical protein [Rhodococcus sp. 1168]